MRVVYRLARLTAKVRNKEPWRDFTTSKSYSGRPNQSYRSSGRSRARPAFSSTPPVTAAPTAELAVKYLLVLLARRMAGPAPTTKLADRPFTARHFSSRGTSQEYPDTESLKVPVAYENISVFPNGRVRKLDSRDHRGRNRQSIKAPTAYRDVGASSLVGNPGSPG